MEYQEYLTKMSKQLVEWSERLEIVRAKIAQGSAEVRADYDIQLADWHTKEQAFRAKLQEIRAAGVHGFEAIKAGAQVTWKELDTVVEKFGEKKL